VSVYLQPLYVTGPNSYQIRQNDANYAVQGHRLWYQWKAHMRLPISDNINLPSILHQFRIRQIDSYLYSAYKFKRVTKRN